jgi:hypothetical protein
MVVVPDYRDGFKDIPKNYVQKETQQSGLGYDFKMLRHLYFACCRSDLAIEPAR